MNKENGDSLGLPESRETHERIDGCHSSPAELFAVAILCSYFLVKLLYFALNVAPGLPPDEATHVGIIEIYRDAFLIPQDSAESFHLGLISRTPFLYYLSMGKLLHLNFLGFTDLTFLRLINVVVSMTTIVLAWYLATRLTSSRTVRLLALAAITNILMFTFLSSSVSYDNLVNLLSVAAVLLLFLHLERPSARKLLGLAIICLAGGLTKLSYLPLALILVMLLLLERRTAILGDLSSIGISIKNRVPMILLLSITTLLLFGANLSIYGVNKIQYGRLVPSCDSVLPLEACMQNRIFARNWVVGAFRSSKLEYQEAVARASSIRNPGDRDHAIRLLNNERNFQMSRQELLNPISYMDFVWKRGMMPSIFGIQAHRSLLPSPNRLLPHTIVLLAALLLWIRYLDWSPERRRWLYLGLIAIAYYVILVGWYNYRSHLHTHAPLLGVQGRYIFPVLVPALLAASNALLSPFKREGRAQWIAACALAATFIVMEFPYFLRHSDESWFASNDRSVIVHPSAPLPESPTIHIDGVAVKINHVFDRHDSSKALHPYQPLS